MHEIQEMMNKLVEEGNKYKMDYLGEVFVDMAHELKHSNPMMYKIMKYNMRKLVNDGHLTEMQATCWVDSMENKDGTKGGHWTYEQTEDVRKQYAPDMDKCDWFAILNMVWSDYYNEKFDTTTYIQLAKDWLNDKDISKCKALKYYMFVVK